MTLKNGERLFSFPVKEPIITAGWTYSDGSAHNALDFRAAEGTPVYAAEDGQVNQVQNWTGSKTGMQSYGNMVRIRHSDYNGRFLFTRYAHLSTIVVKNGQWVKAGDVIGYSGNTGNSTAPHLHFEVIYNYNRVNPLNWLSSAFSCASETVWKHLGNYKSVDYEEETTGGDYIKIHATGIDMTALLDVCAERKLDYKRTTR